MYDKYNDYNYLNDNNNIKIISCTSYNNNSNPKNILNDDIKKIWLSEKEVPQSITIDISKMIKKPQNNFEFFGVHLWHAYQTNPKQIEFYYGNSLNNFILIGIYELDLRPGVQLFKIENNNYNVKNGKINYIKIIITKTFGGFRTYLNQIILLENLSYKGNPIFGQIYYNNVNNNNNNNNLISESNFNNSNDNNNIINDNNIVTEVNEEEENEETSSNVLSNKSSNKMKNINNNNDKSNNKNNNNNFHDQIFIKQNKLNLKRPNNLINPKTKEISTQFDLKNLISPNNSQEKNLEKLKQQQILYTNNNTISNTNTYNKTIDTTQNKYSNTNSNINVIADEFNIILDDKLKDLDKYLKTIGANEIDTNEAQIGNLVTNTNRNKTFDEKFEEKNKKNENIILNSDINEKIDKIDEKINKIKNDVSDIKNIFLKFNEMEDNNNINNNNDNDNNNYENNNNNYNNNDISNSNINYNNNNNEEDDEKNNNNQNFENNTEMYFDNNDNIINYPPNFNEDYNNNNNNKDNIYINKNNNNNNNFNNNFNNNKLKNPLFNQNSWKYYRNKRNNKYNSNKINKKLYNEDSLNNNNNYNSYNNNNYFHNNNNIITSSSNTLLNESYLKKLDNNLNNKLQILSNNIEQQIYDNYIEPSIKQFNQKMLKSISEIKKQIENISNSKNNKINSYKKDTKSLHSQNSSIVLENEYSQENNNNNNNLFYKFNKKESDSYKEQSYNNNNNNNNNNNIINNNNSSSNSKDNFIDQYKTITKLSNKLYEKLCKKERMLKEQAEYLKNQEMMISTFYSQQNTQ